MSGEISIHRVILGGHLLQLMTQDNVSPPVANMKRMLTETYVKLVIQVKTKVRCLALSSSSGGLKYASSVVWLL